VDETCGTCALGTPSRFGLMRCAFLPRYTRTSSRAACQLTPSRYLAADFIEREARLVLACDDLDGRRRAIETFVGLYGAEAGEKLRARVKELWQTLKAEERAAERKWT
jgi:hypothetical protein